MSNQRFDKIKSILFFSQVEKMVKEFDDDGSGLIEFEEFLVLMAKKVDSSTTLLFARSILPFADIFLSFIFIFCRG